MNLLQLQQRLIEFTEQKVFVSLESFRDEFQSADLKGFEQFVSFKEESYCSKTLFRTDTFEIRPRCCWYACAAFNRPAYQQLPKNT